MSITISAIASIQENSRHGIGIRGDLPWREIREDRENFKSKIKDHVLIMGRTTYDNNGQRPLNNKLNIVVSNGDHDNKDGFAFVKSIDEAIKLANQKEGYREIFVVGGADIYALALPYLDKLYLTIVRDDSRCDKYFPYFEGRFKKQSGDEEWKKEGGVEYAFTEWSR